MPFPGLPTASSYAHRAQAGAAAVRRGDAKPLRVTRKVKAAIDAMVFEGATRKEAAQLSGIADNSLRSALTKPHVLAYLNEQQEVLRTGARPKALRRIIALVDKAESERVQLDAAKYLDGMDRTIHQQGAQVNVNVGVKVETPGYVIDLSGHPSGQQIEHLARHDANRLADNAGVPEDE